MIETQHFSLIEQPDAESVHRLVHGFYAEVRADAELGPLFDGAIGDHWDTHLARMVDFWSTVMLGARSFRGDVFSKHMALDGVQPGHFATWLQLWQRTTEAIFIPEVARELQTVAHGIARNLFRGYFGHLPERAH
ncbi:globin [Melaminivora suipulveris]|uniref:Globin n=1 Tax=Melaminivora suipulveris TaxID=2109913 RepID=A0A2R3Q828_9BURK|nr:group III truncated hemoglobin [Melaminivora suipulveris]AVO47919.1 globin [Melaminivora suipulveris]